MLNYRFLFQDKPQLEILKEWGGGIEGCSFSYIPSARCVNWNNVRDGIRFKEFLKAKCLLSDKSDYAGPLNAHKSLQLDPTSVDKFHWLVTSLVSSVLSSHTSTWLIHLFACEAVPKNGKWLKAQGCIRRTCMYIFICVLLFLLHCLLV